MCIVCAHTETNIVARSERSKVDATVCYCFHKTKHGDSKIFFMGPNNLYFMRCAFVVKQRHYCDHKAIPLELCIKCHWFSDGVCRRVCVWIFIDFSKSIHCVYDLLLYVSNGSNWESRTDAIHSVRWVRDRQIVSATRNMIARSQSLIVLLATCLLNSILSRCFLLINFNAKEVPLTESSKKEEKPSIVTCI